MMQMLFGDVGDCATQEKYQTGPTERPGGLTV